MAGRATGSAASSRPTSLMTRPSTAGSTVGWSRASSTGASSSHQGDAHGASTTQGSVSTATRRPVTPSTASMTRLTITITRGAAPHRRPAEACATIGHTDPGTYLPSWVTKNVEPASRVDTVTPAPRTRHSHTLPIASVASTASTVEPANAATPIACNASARSSASRARR